MSLAQATKQLILLIRQHNLTYDTFFQCCQRARKETGLLKLSRRGKHLPTLLQDTDLEKFYQTVERYGGLRDTILLKLLFYTGLRVSEIINIKRYDIYLNESKIFIRSGKGDKDRYVLFPESFRLALRAYMGTVEDRSCQNLFISNQNKAMSRRRVNQLIEKFADLAGIEISAHPHLFRHQMLTYLTRSGLADSQIQLISGHSSKKSLEVYQHIGLGDVEGDYQEAMRKSKI